MNSTIFLESDLEFLQTLGISQEEALWQVNTIEHGFPFLNVIASASLEYGIMRVDEEQKPLFLNEWDDYLNQHFAKVTKFVPASGAASRMFKELYNFLESDREEPETEAVIFFFDNIQHFAFYEALNESCLRNDWQSVPKLINSKHYKAIVENLLLGKGLNYGSLPKGLLLFHQYDQFVRIAAEEHLVEGALYCKNWKGEVYIHYSVSQEHLSNFKAQVDRLKEYYEDRYCVRYQIDYSVQKHSTDTLALTMDFDLFRDESGKPLLRPGGHGALIENLQELDADIVFIKNIDNVVPDYLKCDTIIFKKLLAGILISLRKRIFAYLELIERDKVTRNQLSEIISFMKENLCIELHNVDLMNEKELIEELFNKLNRPIRVCGMVVNQGEPGGGPFVISEPDGSTSLQILESTQIDMNNPEKKAFFQEGRYFNPVDLVCSLSNYKGEKFDLLQYINPKTSFVSEKSKDGRTLLALERPGLWNGAMDNWNTVFVEVPISTFNPVKTVNDLLRPEHQPLK